MYLGTYLVKRAAICYEIKCLMQKFFNAACLKLRLRNSSVLQNQFWCNDPVPPIHMNIFLIWGFGVTEGSFITLFTLFKTYQHRTA